MKHFNNILKLSRNAFSSFKELIFLPYLNVQKTCDQIRMLEENFSPAIVLYGRSFFRAACKDNKHMYV